MNLTRRQQLMTVRVLVFSILLYPSLTYLATPLVQSHANGQWTVVCTLQGEKAVFVDFGGQPDAAPDSCPALKLLQLLGSSPVSVPSVVPGHPLYALATSGTFQPVVFRPPPFLEFSSRAPPLA